MSQGAFIRPDYGDHQRQHQDWLERTGLDDPADRYDPPAGPPLRLVPPVTVYPLDEAA